MSSSQSLNDAGLTTAHDDMNDVGLTAAQAMQTPLFDERTARVALQRRPKLRRHSSFDALPHSAMSCEANPSINVDQGFATTPLIVTQDTVECDEALPPICSDVTCCDMFL